MRSSSLDFWVVVGECFALSLRVFDTHALRTDNRTRSAVICVGLGVHGGRDGVDQIRHLVTT